MSIQDQTGGGASEEKQESKAVSRNIDPSNIMETAQEMISEMMKANQAAGQQETVKSNLSPEEIKAMQEEQKAILDDVAAKITAMQSLRQGRESKEIADEAWQNWGDEIS